jgi:cytochrome b subunit of formate dehydrogenase
MRRNLGAASLISFVMVVKVHSINAFRIWANSSGMIKDEESLSREWNSFKHVARQREENRISVPQRKLPSGGRVEREENPAHLNTAQAWSSAS